MGFCKPHLFVQSATQLFMLVVLLILLGACAVFTPVGTDAIRGTDIQLWHRDNALQKLIDEKTKSYLTTDNSVRLLVNGVEGFARRYENMRSARFIFVKTFLFTDDEEGRRMATALSERARAGIPVVLQYDVKGSIASTADVADMLKHTSSTLPIGEKRIIHDMREAGVTIVPTNSLSRPYELKEWWENIQRFFQSPIAALKRSTESLVLFDYCDHEKYFITGHEGGEIRAIVGGMNIASEYAWGGILGRKDTVTGKVGWHDVDVEVRGPAAYAAFREFLSDMKMHTGRELPSRLAKMVKKITKASKSKIERARVRFVVHHPLSERKRYVEDLYRILMQATPPGEPIFIATAYFAPSKRIRDAIIEHAKLGGIVTVLTNSLESNNHPILTVAAHYAALEIMKNTENFHLYEWKPRAEKGEQTMHQKLASFGRFGPVIVGSFNLDAQSAVHNTESVYLIDEPSFRERFDQLTERYLSQEYSKRIFREDLETEPILKRIHSFLTHELAWYWL